MVVREREVKGGERRKKYILTLGKQKTRCYDV